MRVSVIAGVLAAALAAFGFQDNNQGSIAGQVVNQATGAPLKDAIVTLHFVNPGGPAENLVRQTNDAGRFSFANLWGRDWELSAECSGFAPATYRATRYDPHGSFSLKKNEQIKDIVLKLTAQAVITGRVVDADRKPVEGARVTLLKPSHSGGVVSWTEVASAATLDNGEYRIPRVTSGKYAVRATVPTAEIQRLRSEAEVEMGYGATYHPNATDPSLASVLEVTDGREIRGIDIQLVPTRLFHLKGKLQPPAEGPNQGQVVLVDRQNPAKIIATATTQPPEQLFDINRVPAGSYLVYAKMYVRPLFQNVQGEQPLDVAGRDLEGLVLRLARPDPISGVIRPTPENAPVDLHKIAVRIPLIPVGKPPDGVNWNPREIGKDLTFRMMHGADAGFADVVRFQVQVSNLPENCYVASIRYGSAEVPESGVEYSPGAGLVITIGTDGGRVDGTTLGEDDKPVGNAVLGLFPAGGTGKLRSVQADAQGKFHIPAVPPGDYKLIAWDDVSRDDLEDPEFVKQFDAKATAISVTAKGSVAASMKVVSH